MRQTQSRGFGRRGAPAGRRLRRAWPALAACLLVAALAPLTLVAPPPAAAQNAGASVSELIPAGSLVIPMDNTLQLSGSLFNLRAYGMVERLL